VGEPLVRDDGGIRVVTLDRPEVRNALTLDDLAVVQHAFTVVPSDICGVVLTGTGGRAMSAGMHVDTFTSAPPGHGREIIDQVGAAVGAVRRCEVPTAVAVDGYCLGAAFEMALAADFRIASAQSKFGLPEVRLGIPSVIEASLLVPHVGLSLAKEMILTAAAYSIDALPPGFVNRVADDPVTVAVDLLREVAASTREVLTAQKQLFDTWLDVSLTDGIEESKRVFGEVFAHPATQQAIRSYRRR
jgi:enoyl-CoA hydratase/carnithine racemase